MRSVSILSFASLLALAAAQPANKRDMVTVTEIETVIKTIDVTSTIYANEVPEATPVAQPSHVAGGHHHGHQHAHQHPKPSPSSIEVADPPHTHVHSPKPHTHTEEIPTPTPVAPPTTTAAPPPPPPAPTSTKVAPPPSPSPSPPSGGAPASSFAGDMTHYAPGLGSCGTTSSASEPVVALAVPMMANPANPNLNPKCGQKITIEFDGQQHEATVMDTCYACAMEDIDLSPTLFKAVAPTGDGRVSNVKWWFNNPSYM